MKWRTLKPGDRRTRRRFAYLPTDCDDGTTRWLEWVLVTETYYALFCYDMWVRSSTVAERP